MARTPIALVGAGVIARPHIERIAQNPAIQLLAVADMSLAARAGTDAAGAPRFAGHREVLAAVRPASAIVAKSNALRVQVALDCLARGAPVRINLIHEIDLRSFEDGPLSTLRGSGARPRPGAGTSAPASNHSTRARPCNRTTWPTRTARCHCPSWRFGTTRVIATGTST